MRGFLQTMKLKTPQIKCGRGLAPDGGGSAKQSLTDTPSSGASPLPHWIGFTAQRLGRLSTRWCMKGRAPVQVPLKNNRIKCGRGLAPDGGGSAKQSLTDTPSSGASPLPHWIGFTAQGLGRLSTRWCMKGRTPVQVPLKNNRIKCGRGLAPDGGGSAKK